MEFNFDASNIIQNLSGIGTFITALIALFTLKVLVKQRKDTFRPQVIFGDRIEAKCLNENENILKTKWIENYRDDEELFDFCFELYNIGNGVAEDVKVKEVFNYNEAIDFIKKHDTKNEIKFESYSSDKSDLVIRTTFDNSFIILDTNKTPRELGTFLPTPDFKKRKYVFTNIFLDLLSCYDYLQGQNKSDIALDKFPRCRYEITFKDKEGKKYKTKYECKVYSLLKDSYSFEFIKK